MQHSTQALVDKIDEAITLANKLCFMGQVVNDREKAALRKWMARWREVKQRVVNATH